MTFFRPFKLGALMQCSHKEELMAGGALCQRVDDEEPLGGGERFDSATTYLHEE